MKKIYFPKLMALFLIVSFPTSSCGQIDSTPAIASSPALTDIGTPTAMPTLYEQTLPLFNYDSSIPFEMTVVSEREQDGVIIQDLTYMALDSEYTRSSAGKIMAYLVKPAQNGSYAGVLFAHGFGNGWGNRDQFLEEAVSLAHQGVVSILPIGLFPWMVQYSADAEQNQTKVIKQVIELRRSLDLLLIQPGIDPERIAFVGHDYGAMHGAVLAGVEKRIAAYVLMAGDASYSDWAITYFVKPKDEEAFRTFGSAVDPITYLPHVAPAKLFFQFAESDRFIPRESADQSFQAASEPKEISMYDSAGHTLNEQARQDRLAWLVSQLGLEVMP
jgi:dienelactone hydrolase